MAVLFDVLADHGRKVLDEVVVVAPDLGLGVGPLRRDLPLILVLEGERVREVVIFVLKKCFNLTRSSFLGTYLDTLSIVAQI